jgi:uncharacterized protein YaaQ
MMKKTVVSEKTKDYLLIAVVQSQDAENAEDALCKEDFSVTRFPSVGAFLGRKNATLMIGLPKIKRKRAIELLRSICRERVEYIAVPLESAPLPMPNPTPITIGGATIFGMNIEHFEEV